MSGVAHVPVERTSLFAGGTRTRLLQAGAGVEHERRSSFVRLTDYKGRTPADEAVVFVHGNPGSADDWERLVAAAAGTGRRALAFDLPDFGETVAPRGFEHSAVGYARFVGQALAELGVERAHLVLHDFGGPIGLVWAATEPGALASITLIDTGLLPGYRWHLLARIWRTPVLGEVFQAIATRAAFRFAQNRIEPRGLPREFVDRMYDQYDRRTRAAVLKLYRATDDPGGMSEALIGLFAEREIPALVIWGEHDAYLPASYAHRQRDAFPAADVHVLPASGHWPFADAPDTVERLLVEFLTEPRR
jgi:pimeloyl-ACP methyl ester carboxylesterase